jgi:ferredoxin-fold anticodon binding domain-containing protein
MNLIEQLQLLVSKQITVRTISDGVECAGTLQSVNGDCIILLQGGAAQDAALQWLVPITAIACVTHRS